ncbi:hypothetical protein MP228_007227 [Amoeboaphelidium protococcarum]|nr:hypothetical protein MP228_007227 [Amoeboaphelidium protococcarum]
MRVLMVGTGEYTVGIPPSVNAAGTQGSQSSSNSTDKKMGVVALTMFHLRQRGMVEWIGLCGTSAEKVEGSIQWLNDGIGQMYSNLSTQIDECWPKSGANLLAYQDAIDSMSSGSAVTIFTPDSTHYPIALYAIQKGMHVMIAKPTVHHLKEHDHLIEESRTHNVVVCTEFHKRFDPIYKDARNKIVDGQMGADLSYFYAYMSQPKYQLKTFKSWAGVSSDISYYLNSHHIDFLCWSYPQLKPVSVYASASKGIASSADYGCSSQCEDTITLLVEFASGDSNSAHAVFTSSWVAPDKAEVHSQQRFHLLGSAGEIRIDQAHRGYETATDLQGYKSNNPLFWTYTPDQFGQFNGQQTYGYQSFQVWIEACQLVSDGKLTLDTLEELLTVLASDASRVSDNTKLAANKLPFNWQMLALVSTTRNVTTILEAGKKSLVTGQKVQL